MIQRLLEWFASWTFSGCTHDGTWEPFFYGRLIATDDLVLIDVCTECGATIVRRAD